MSTETDASTGVQTTKFIMKSINYGNTHVTDYDYVPAETGVLVGEVVVEQVLLQISTML